MSEGDKREENKLDFHLPVTSAIYCSYVESINGAVKIISQETNFGKCVYPYGC